MGRQLTKNEGRRFRPSVVAIAALTVLAAPSSASAQATAEVAVEQGAATGATVNPCTGEISPATGRFVIVHREVVDAEGGVHTASIGTSVLRSDDAVAINHQADPGPTNFNANGASNVTDVLQIMTVSRGSEDNSFEHINHTNVVTPDGDQTAHFNVKQRCQG